MGTPHHLGVERDAFNAGVEVWRGEDLLPSGGLLDPVSGEKPTQLTHTPLLHMTPERITLYSETKMATLNIVNGKWTAFIQHFSNQWRFTILPHIICVTVFCMNYKIQ